MQRWRLMVWLTAVMSIGLTAALDAQSKPVEEPLTTIRLDGPWRGVDGRVRVLLSVELAPGWRTYWRAPGEAGVPPRFDWSGSKNVENVEISWPVPQVFGSYGMRTYGYENAVAFPLVVTPTADSDGALLVGDVTLGVCREICVFSNERVELSLSRETGLAAASPLSSRRLAASMMLTPSSGAEQGLQLRRCQRGDSYRARLEGESVRRGWRRALVEDPSTGYVAEAELIEDDQNYLWVTAQWPSRLQEVEPVVTLIGAQGAVELDGCAP